MPDLHRRIPTLALLCQLACTPPAPTPAETGSAQPHHDPTPAVERPAPPAPFLDRPCTWTTPPTADPTPPFERTCSLTLAARTPDFTQMRFTDGRQNFELRFDQHSLTLRDGLVEASADVQGVRESEPCWQAVLRASPTPAADSPLFARTLEYTLLWCTNPQQLQLTRIAETAVGTRTITLRIAD